MRFGTAIGILAHPQVLVQIVGAHGDLTRELFQQQALDHLAADFGEFSFQGTDPGFTGVVTHHIAHGVFGDHQFAVLDPVVGHLLGQQVFQSDVGFFVFGVARQTNHFHAIKQRRRDVHGVRGGHEHDVAQVVIDFHIVVAEGVVLLRVQHLQQSAGRVATEVGAEFVNLVQQKQGVAGANLGQALQHLAWHGAYVGATVTSNFSLVTHPTQSHAHVFPSGGFGNGLPQGGFTHPRRPDQTQNGGLDLVHALLHREVFQNSVLDLFKTVVVFVQNTFGIAQIVFDFGFFMPGQTHQDIDVVAHHRSLRRHGRHEFEFL